MMRYSSCSKLIIYINLLLSCLCVISSALTSPQIPIRSLRSEYDDIDRHSKYSFFDVRTATSALGLFGKKSVGQGDEKNTQTINGKPVNAKVGERLSVVAKKAKVPITYSCRKGDCGTCEIMMNGLIVKACQEKIPLGKCVIKTF